MNNQSPGPLHNLPHAELGEQLRLLTLNAQALVQQGNYADAETLYLQIVDIAPRNLEALRFLAGRHLQRRQFQEAKGMLERALQLQPDDALLHQNHAIVLRALGFPEAALRALNRALHLNPMLGMGWLQRGDMLAQLRRDEDATIAYLQAEGLMGDLFEVADQARLPRRAATLRRGAKHLQVAKTQYIDRALRAVRTQYKTTELKRAEEALRAFLKYEKPSYPDPLQRPSFARFPGLTTQPFYDRKLFPYLKQLEAEASAIKQEFQTLIAAGTEHLNPYVQISPAQNPAQWADLNHSPKWSSYHLFQNGKPLRQHCERCPITTAALDKLPSVQLPGQSPEAFFSILKPKTHIPPHHGLANYKLTAHLPLIVPPGCVIRVGDISANWTVGKCLVFDDSFEHEVWNRSEESRAVLIFEIWHPDLTEAEIAFLQAMLTALNEFFAYFSKKATDKQ